MAKGASVSATKSASGKHTCMSTQCRPRWLRGSRMGVSDLSAGIATDPVGMLCQDNRAIAAYIESPLGMGSPSAHDLAYIG